MLIRIRNKIPGTSEERHKELLETQWVLIREPKSIGLSILASIPFMVLNSLITLFILRFFSSISLRDFGLNGSSISLSINIFHIMEFFLILVIHEFLHLIFIPNFVKSEKTYFGIKPFYGFVYSEEIIPRNRHIIISLAPFIIISVILPVLAGFAGLLNPFAIFLVLLNSIGSSVDVLTMILVATQTPPESYIISNGIQTYWRTQSGHKPESR